MKKTFYIDVEGLVHSTVEVQAESDVEARAIFSNLVPEQIFGNDVISVYSIEDPIITDVYEG